MNRQGIESFAAVSHLKWRDPGEIKILDIGLPSLLLGYVDTSTVPVINPSSDGKDEEIPQPIFRNR